MLQAVLLKKIEEHSLKGKLFAESCGIGYWHLGEPPDPRAIKAAEKRGYEITHTSKLFHRKSFQKFAYILAVDKEIESALKEIAKSEKERSKIFLATHFNKELQGKEIIDPYLKDLDSFFSVIDMAEEISEGIISHFFSK